MVYPKNNFATDAKYWAREVEKKVTNLENSLQSSDINNTTRDSQLSVAAGQALIAANEAKTAINGIVSLGSDGSTYDIHGGNLTAGTVTADTVRAGYVYSGEIEAGQIQAGTINSVNIVGGTLATSGTRHVEVSGSQATFYDGSGTLSGRVTAGENGRAGTMYFGTGITGVFAYNGGMDLEANGVVKVPGGNGMEVTGDLTTDGSLTRTLLIGAGTTGASITSGGNFVRTSSSERYKTDIEDAEFNLESVLKLQPKTFRLKEEVEEDSENAITYPGFIAEEIAGTSLDIFVNYETLPDGTKRPDGVRYAELTAALVSAIKEQNATIKTLEARLDALEAR